MVRGRRRSRRSRCRVSKRNSRSRRHYRRGDADSMATRVARRRLSRSHNKHSSERSPITTPGAPGSAHASTFDSPIHPFPVLDSATPLHILPPDSERAEPSTHVIRPPIDGVITHGDLRFSRMPSSWNLVRVGNGTFVVCIVNTFLMEVQVDYHMPITQSMENVINTASQLFPTQPPPNPDVYVIQRGSIENVSQLSDSFLVVPVNDGTTRNTIQQTLNENRDKIIVFVYSGHFPQSLFEGLPGFKRFPDTSEL